MMTMMHMMHNVVVMTREGRGQLRMPSSSRARWWLHVLACASIVGSASPREQRDVPLGSSSASLDGSSRRAAAATPTTWCRAAAITELGGAGFGNHFDGLATLSSVARACGRPPPFASGRARGRLPLAEESPPPGRRHPSAG